MASLAGVYGHAGRVALFFFRRAQWIMDCLGHDAQRMCEFVGQLQKRYLRTRALAFMLAA